jgi:acyl transferase domain-containing protein/phosphopantetheinyl transferase
VSTSSDDIAIVGLSATFAGAADLTAYWQNIVDKVDAVRDAPDEWALPYFDPEARRSDRIYTRRGGFLGELAEFDPLSFGIMPKAVDGGEPDQYLALKLASAALADAGYDKRPFDRRRTGVILGRGTYINRGYTNLMQHGMMLDQTLELLRRVVPELDDDTLERLRDELNASLPPFNAEMCPGLVPNVVTGRIANRLDLMGPNFIVDAACASSLIATELSIRELLSGRCDMMLTGGVHASTPPQIYMIFCQLDALSRGAIRPFQRGAGGVLLGEGAGVLVIKRLADAERDEDRIYAVLKGVGSSSDGKALGLLAPRLEGEILALQRAYEAAGVTPDSVGLVEAHGTGIPLGDQTEIKALGTLFGARDGRVPHCAIGSVKSMISHCIPAAGAAGLIKTALALYHRVLPPTLCDEVDPKLGIEATPLYVNNQTRPWIHGSAHTPRRAGVNAFGFGGINAHVILEEYRGPAGQPDKLLHRRWPTELVVMSADGRGGLLQELDRVVALLDAKPEASLASVALSLARRSPGASRLAVVAKDAVDLLDKLRSVRDKLAEPGRDRLQARSGIYFGHRLDPGRIAFVLAGEGSQYPGMLADLCLHFPPVRAWLDFLDATFYGRRSVAPGQLIFPPPTCLSPEEREGLERGLFAMDVGSEAVFASSMALVELLGRFGVRPDAFVGHSTGENTALVASGILRVDDHAELAERMRDLNDIYLDLTAGGAIPTGALLAVGALPREEALAVVAGSDQSLHVAMDNCPNQLVLFGSEEAVGAAARQLGERGAVCQRLPFDRAYHTALFAPVSEAFMAFYRRLPLGAARIPVLSCTALDYFPDEPQAIQKMAASQWALPVRFREAVERLGRDGFRTFVEVSPNGNLTSFIKDTLRKQDHLAVSCDSRRQAGLTHLQHSLARLFVNGVDVRAEGLFDFREVAPLDFAPASAAMPVRPRQRLELNLPRLRLPEATITRLRRPVAPPASKSAAGVRAAAGSAAGPADPRSQLLQGHFALMRQFLEQQQRVMTGLADEPSAGAEPRPAEEGEALRWPLLGPVTVEPDGTLVSRRCVDLTRDRYLRDHTLGSAPSLRSPELLALPVIPFTFSMELVAQAAHRLLKGRLSVVRLENLRGSRWLTLDRGRIDLLIRARAAAAAGADERRRVNVRVFQSDLPGAPPEGVLVFEGEVLLGSSRSVPPAALDLDPTALSPSRLTEKDLYSTGMFHGPMLQGVRRILGWSAEGIEAELVVIPTDGFFAGQGPVSLQTDAGLLDAAGQLVGYWLSEQFGSDFNCFPYRVGVCEQYLPWPGAGAMVRCRGRIRFVSDTQIEAAFDLLGADGQVVARLSGWEDRYFRIPTSFYELRLRPQLGYLSERCPFPGSPLVCRRSPVFPEHFLDDGYGIWKRVLAHLVLCEPERAYWYTWDASPAQRTDWLLGRLVAKDAVRAWASAERGLSLAPADVEIRSDGLGRPIVHCPALGDGVPEVSITHSAGRAMAIAAPAGVPVGLDLQVLDGVSSPDVVAAAFTAEERRLLDDFPRAEHPRLSIAMWCAKEAAAKAAGTGLQGAPLSWRVAALDPGRAVAHVIREGSDWRVLLALGEAEVAALCTGSLAVLAPSRGAGAG